MQLKYVHNLQKRPKLFDTKLPRIASLFYASWAGNNTRSMYSKISALLLLLMGPLRQKKSKLKVEGASSKYDNLILLD